MDNFKQMIKTKIQDISSKDLSIDFAEPKVILVQSIIRQMIRMVVDIIEKDLSSAQPEQRWIPCSERLPEKCGVYLVSSGSRVWLCELVQIMTVYGWANDARNPVVTAWMPLPEPYKTIQRGTE